LCSYSLPSKRKGSNGGSSLTVIPEPIKMYLKNQKLKTAKRKLKQSSNHFDSFFLSRCGGGGEILT
jgi:hypothetical protein